MTRLSERRTEMKISDLLTRERIHLDGTASGKIEVIAQAVALMAESGNIL